MEIKKVLFKLEQKQNSLDETEIKSPIAETEAWINSRVGRFADIVNDDKPLLPTVTLEISRIYAAIINIEYQWKMDR